MPTSTLAEITDCSVSPLPCVYSTSSASPCFLKKPAFCPSSDTHCSQPPRCPTAILSVSCAAAAPAQHVTRTASAARLSIPICTIAFLPGPSVAQPNGTMLCSPCRRGQRGVSTEGPLMLRLLIAALLTAAAASPSGAADWPNQREGDAVLEDFRFASGEALPDLKLHYRTLGTPRR